MKIQKDDIFKSLQIVKHSLRKKCPHSELFGPYFLTFALNKESIQSECE